MFFIFQYSTPDVEQQMRNNTDIEKLALPTPYFTEGFRSFCKQVVIQEFTSVVVLQSAVHC